MFEQKTLGLVQPCSGVKRISIQFEEFKTLIESESESESTVLCPQVSVITPKGYH